MGILGYFARDGRAIVRLRVSGPSREKMIKLELDTGAEPSLLLSREIADELGIATFPGHFATLADGSRLQVEAGSISVDWIDGQREVEVIVWSKTVGETRSSGPESPDGLLGRGLLWAASVWIDHQNRELEITDSKPKGT